MTAKAKESRSEREAGWGGGAVYLYLKPDGKVARMLHAYVLLLCIEFVFARGKEKTTRVAKFSKKNYDLQLGGSAVKSVMILLNGAFLLWISRERESAVRASS